MGLSFDVRGRFESFINQFENEQGELRYREMIREMEPRGLRSFEISYNDLLIFDPDLANGVLTYPEESLQIGVEVLRSILMQVSPSYVERLIQLHVRIINLTEKIKLRSLKTEHLGLLTNFVLVEVVMTLYVDIDHSYIDKGVEIFLQGNQQSDYLLHKQHT